MCVTCGAVGVKFAVEVSSDVLERTVDMRQLHHTADEREREREREIYIYR